MADEAKLSEVDYKLKYTGEEVDNLLAFVKDFKNIYNKMKRVQAGCETISTTTAGADVIKVIDFSVAFNNVPNVILIPVLDEQKLLKCLADYGNGTANLNIFFNMSLYVVFRFKKTAPLAIINAGTANLQKAKLIE